MKKNVNKSSRENGFTLTEVILSVVLVGIVTSLALGILHTQARTYSQIYNRSLMTFEARNALRLLRSEIRSMNPNNISTLSAGTLEFTDVQNNTVLYNYKEQDKELIRNNQVILKNLTAAPFQYLDKDQNVTEQKSEVRFVKINLQLAAGNESAQMEELIYVRN